MKILEFFKAQMETPPAYGWFHLMMFALTIITTVLLCIFFKDVDDKKYRKIVFIFWIVFLVFQIYKELTFSINWDFDETGKLLGISYNWHLFPYQFCSTPFYILPFIIFLPKGKVRNAFISFVSSFVLFAGLIVMIIPGDVFVKQIGINIQTMIHHGSQVVLGIYTATYLRNKYKGSFKDLVNLYWPGLVVFAGMALIAIGLNEIMFYSGALDGQTFNMFFISSHFPCTLPILNSFANDLPYFAFLLIYLIGFAIVAALMITFEWIGIVPITNLINKIKNKLSFKNE